MSAPGDSGGPMFVDGAVAAITSGGFIDPVEPSKAVAVYLDLNISESQELIRTARAAGAVINTAAKGPLQSAPFASHDNACGGAQ